jgi:transposase
VAKKLPNPVGRPTDYKPEYCSQLEEHMASGLSYESFAGTVRVSKQTLYDWEAKYSGFLDAKRIGFELNRLWWEKLGTAHITHTDSKFESTPKLNSPVYIFNMKNRFPKEWRDRTEVKQEVKINSKELEDMSDEELADLSKRALEAFKSK